MSDVTNTSCCNNTCDNGMNPMFLILILLLCSGDNGFLGCGGGSCGSNNNCGCGGDGLNGILPLILILCMCGGGSFF